MHQSLLHLQDRPVVIPFILCLLLIKMTSSAFIQVSDHDDEEGVNHKRLKTTNTTVATTDSCIGVNDGEENHTESQSQLSKFEDVLSVEFLNAVRQSLDFCQASYNHKKPFPYGCIPSIFQISFIQQVIQEIKDHSIVNFKESDLFKVFQSIDLANLQNDDAKTMSNMPSVMKLRSVLYSPEFRHFVEDMNELPRNTLSDNVDSACNCHMTGCHLLCHDDVIGTRKVSYILYLTENDPPWQAEEGGALELYDNIVVNGANKTVDDVEADSTTARNDPAKIGQGQIQPQRRIPTTVPCQSILPICNTMVYFVVEPGYSFHAVQEVLGERPRLSLQGWYHSSTGPNNMEHATLQRLKAYQNPQVVEEENTEGVFMPMVYPIHTGTSDSATISEKPILLSETDRLYLRSYIQETYLTDTAIAEIRSQFEQDSSVQLRNFLLDTWVQQFHSMASLADTKPEEKHQQSKTTSIDPTNSDYYQLGVSNRWKTIGPAHKQRFLEYQPTLLDTTTTEQTKMTASDQAGSILYHNVGCSLLQSSAFGNYLSTITNLGTPTAYRGRVRRFRPGRDYTVAHYGLLTQRSVLDATLCFVRGSRYISEGDISNTSLKNDDLNGNVNDQSVEMDELDEVWQSGDCGGFECYIAADEEEDSDTEKIAADEYNADDDTELLSVSASNNTLSLVYRDPGTMRFVKYVGSKAPSSRWDVAMEYEVPEEDGEENDCASDSNDSTE
jgi:prolyl 3-hydroxylase /prolyl 3,4-dihydroxylase